MIGVTVAVVMHCIYNTGAVFDWNWNNLRKIRAHRITPQDVEQVLSNNPIPIYEQDVQGELRYVYYGETDKGRLLAVIVTERGEDIRVVTAYGLDGGQKRDYLARRVQGE
jgi:uncharacterized DUF497 family protein